MAAPNAAPAGANVQCVGPASATAGKSSSCDGCPNQSACASGAGVAVDPAVAAIQSSLQDIKHIILVMSGKGGVGKSTISSQLAHTLAHRKYTVGILDIDICGPSVAQMMGVTGAAVTQSNTGWAPVDAVCDEYEDEDEEERTPVAVMSIAFMLGSGNDAVAWRGPRKNGLIKQFLTDVNWGALDFLLIDSPPGTSDEHMSIINFLSSAAAAGAATAATARVNFEGALIVTTPQETALLDVRKGINFCKKTNTTILGVVENMAGFVCPCCHTKSDIFVATTGGATTLTSSMQTQLLGSIPIDVNLLRCCEQGKCFVRSYSNSTATAAVNAMVDNVLSSTPTIAATAAAHNAKHPELAVAAAAAAATAKEAAAAAATAAATAMEEEA